MDDELKRLVANKLFASNKIETGSWALALVLNILGLPAEPAAILHRAGTSSPMTETDVLRAGRHFPIKIKAVSSSAKRLDSTHFPAIAQLNNGRFVVVGRVADDKVLYQGIEDGRPIIQDKAAFLEVWSGRLILISRRSQLSDVYRRFDISWFLGAIQKYQHILFEVLIASFFIQTVALATPLIFQVIVDKVLVHRGMSTLEVLMIGLGILSVFDVVLSGLRSYIFSHTTNRIDVELGARIFRHLVELPLAYFQARRVGDSVARVRELETIRNFLTSSALTLVLDLTFGVICVSVIFLYSSILAWVVIATLPLYAVLAIAVTPLFRVRLEEKFQRGAENQAFLVESVTGIETIKAMAVEPIMQRRWEEQLAAYVGSSFKAQTLGIVANQISTLLSKASTVITLYVGAKLVISNELSVGELVAFNMLAGQVTAPVLRLAQLWQDFHQVRISVERIGDILNTQTEPRSASVETVGGELVGEIAIENVTFRYRPDAQPILSDINLTIPAGQVIGVVGPSGSGKSTITKLIQRLYVPEKGRILVDGRDIGISDPTWLRSQIGVVLQENVLFNASVRENIALAHPAATMDDIMAAAKLAGAHEFISAMTNGYDTMIGERGTSLSGGQRQRLAIARALLGNPRILIFDEATSALDYESESIIQHNMLDIVDGRTVIIIAHRLSTVRSAHRIVTIEAGRIVEDGTHDELIGKAGRYASLHRLQSVPGR